MPSLDEIHESIEARLSQLGEEIASLEAARAALNGSNARTTSARNAAARTATKRSKHARAASSARGQTNVSQAATDTAGAGAAAKATEATTTRTAANATPARRTRRSSGQRSKRVEVLLAGKLEALLGESESGLSVAAIVERSGARDAQVRDLLRELDGTGRVRRTGAGRGTRWRVVTDEERIAERAAELAARSSRGRSR
jgi:hypothetical protein